MQKWAHLVIAQALFLAACGGGNNSTPTNPSPAPAPTNHSPVITGLNVNPVWGITTLTAHSFTSSATDEDGDALTYSWDIGGQSFPGSNVSVTLNNPDTTTYHATVTVRDSKGASANSSVDVTSVAMKGTFTGTMMGSPVTVSLTQYQGGLVMGTWQLPGFGYSGDVGPTGEPGKINPAGQFELRFKVKQGRFVDFYYRGNISPNGQQLTGTLQGSGFTGDYMALNKQ